MTPRELADKLFPATGLYPEEIQAQRRANRLPDIEAAFAQVATKARREALGEAIQATRAAYGHGRETFGETAIRALLDAAVPPTPTAQPTPDFPPWSREMFEMLKYLARTMPMNREFLAIYDAFSGV